MMLCLQYSSQEVDQRLASSFANEVGAIYFETSAKDDTNIQDIFVQLSTFLCNAIHTVSAHKCINQSE